MAEIKLDSVTFSYKNKKDSTPVLVDMSATFESSKISVIVGQSGCGKSTLLRCICGLLNYQGSILFDDIAIDDVSTSERDLAYVNQNYAIYPHISIFESIAFPLKNAHCSIKEIRSRVYEVSDELGIRDILTRKPSQISGGQAQRAALARAIVKRSNILLFDEPLSNVDEQNRSAFRQLIKDKVHKYNATAIYVTHDLIEAINIADEIYLMKDGKFVFSGTPKEVLSSDNKDVKEFFLIHED